MPSPRPEDCFSAHSLESTPEEENGFKGQRKPYGARSSRNINSVIRAKQTSDERWWARNREIVGYLDQGKSVREISRLVGLGERQVRVARERLADLRSNEEVQTRKKEDRADWS